MTFANLLAQYGPRELMEYGVVIVGGSPGFFLLNPKDRDLLPDTSKIEVHP